MNREIKIIDLLNIIANGEKVPNRIRFNRCYIYEYHSNSYNYYDVEDCEKPFFEEDVAMFLNEKVEILPEEEEEIDIQAIYDFDEVRDLSTWSNETLSDNQRTLIKRVSQLIKSVKQLDKKIK